MFKNIAIVYCAIQPYTVRGGRHEATDKCCNRTHKYNMCCTCVHIYYVCMCTVYIHVYIMYTVPFYMFPVTIAYLSSRGSAVGFARFFMCMRATIIGSHSLLKDSSRQNGYTYILDAPPISVHIHDFMRLIHELRRVIPHKLLHTLTNTTYTALQIHETNRHWQPNTEISKPQHHKQHIYTHAPDMHDWLCATLVISSKWSDTIHTAIDNHIPKYPNHNTTNNIYIPMHLIWMIDCVQHLWFHLNDPTPYTLLDKDNCATSPHKLYTMLMFGSHSCGVQTDHAKHEKAHSYIQHWYKTQAHIRNCFTHASCTIHCT